MLYRPGMALDHIAPELPSILLMNCESPHPVGVSNFETMQHSWAKNLWVFKPILTTTCKIHWVILTTLLLSNIFLSLKKQYFFKIDVHVSIVFSFLNSLKNSQCHQCSECCDFYLDTKIILSYFLHGNISYHILVYNNAFYPIVVWIIINIKTGTLTDIEQQFHAFGLVKGNWGSSTPSYIGYQSPCYFFTAGAQSPCYG